MADIKLGTSVFFNDSFIPTVLTYLLSHFSVSDIVMYAGYSVMAMTRSLPVRGV